MALTRVSGRVVYPHGSDTPTPVTGDGVIEYVHATPGIIDGAVHGPDRHRRDYVDGVAAEAWLKPGMWRAYVYPNEGRSYTLHLGVPEDGETTIADAVGEIVPEGIVTRGEQGDPGASVTGGRDNGDGTVSFELSDGTFTAPVVLPPGPAGRGIVSISDPDADSRVTITFTDDTTATVQAIRGAKGDKGDRGADSTVPGPANTLSIGTVTTGATGSAASATITGTAPAQTLNLTLPRGEQGIPGTATLSDTGWRKIELPTGYNAATGHGLYVRRVGSTVHATVAFQATTAGGNVEIWAATSGFQPRHNWPVINGPTASTHLTDGNGSPQAGRAFVVKSNRNFYLFNPDAGQARYAYLTYLTDDAWPSTLPGTPA